MGKLHFPEIYVNAKQALEGDLQIKLSAYCDPYDPHSNFAGMIIYHTYGRYKWQQRPNQGVAGGYRGRAFYVLIMCTDRWPEAALREAGQGRVHDYLYRQYFDMEYHNKKTCCGSFSVLRGETVYSSIWLNQQEGCVRKLRWRSDGSKYLSHYEERMVDLAVDEWRTYGANCIVDVPRWLVCLPVLRATIMHRRAAWCRQAQERISSASNAPAL